MSLQSFGRAIARTLLQSDFVDRARGRIGFPAGSMVEVGVGKGLRFVPGPSNPAYGSGDNELPVQEALAAHLHAGDVFYDVGANVGFFSVIAAGIVGPSGQVIAFEPVPANVKVIRRNARLNQFNRVRIVRKAVFHESRRAELALAEYSGGSVLSEVGRPPDASGSTLRVETISIDDAVFREGFPLPNFVKIDVEGAELDVLRGMERTLREVGPIVLFEVDDASREALEVKMRQNWQFLEERGYELTRLPECYTGIDWRVAHALAKRRGRP